MLNDELKSYKVRGLRLEKRSDINLVFSTSEFNPVEALNTLSFKFKSQSEQICKGCKGKLKHISSLRANESKLINEIRELGDKSSLGLLVEDHTDPVTAKHIRLEAPRTNEESTQVSKAVQTKFSIDYVPPDKQQVVAFIRVCWPSGDRSRKLPNDLTRLGINILRGTYADIGTAMLKHSMIKQHGYKWFLKRLTKSDTSLS